MRNRIAVGIAAPVALVLTVALSACASSSTIDGQGVGGPSGASSSTGPTGSSSPQSGSSSSSSPSTSSGGSPAVSLAAKLAQSLTKIKTAHLRLTISLAGQSVISSGDEQLSNGKLVALDLTEQLPGSGAERLITVGGKGYVKLPAALNNSGKPWILLSVKSSNLAARTIASSLASTQSSASLSSVTAFVSAARSIKHTATSGTGDSYVVDVDPSKLPGSYEGKQALVKYGLKSIPITLQLDSAGRPVLVSEHVTIENKTVSSKVVLSSYNKPVHISAPPAKQVSTR